MLTSFASTIIFALGCIYASMQMHHLLLSNVMRWPMDMFDQTPIGRILNRFSKEVDVIDIVLPMNLKSWMQQFFSVNFTSMCTMVRWNYLFFKFKILSVRICDHQRRILHVQCVTRLRTKLLFFSSIFISCSIGLC